MEPSNFNCGNCDEEFSIESDGDRIQNCPSCDSPEIVKGFDIDKD